MEDQPLIYLAGNPQLYPLEYYDSGTGNYCGAIPELMDRFADAYGYTVVYYQPGAGDRRMSLAENQQVDGVSCVQTGERFPHVREVIPLFTAEIDGETVTYGVAVTEVAPASFAADLASFAASRTASAATGELLSASARAPAAPGVPMPLAAGLGAALALSLAFLAVTSLRRRRAAALARRTDRLTGLLSREGLKGFWEETVREENRALYYLVCFRFGLTHIERLGGPGEGARFQCWAADVLRRRARAGSALCRTESGAYFALCQEESDRRICRWAEGVLEEIQTYTCAGAQLPDSDRSAGIVPLTAAEDFAGALFHARQCAEAVGRSTAGVKLIGPEANRLWEEERELLGDFPQALVEEQFQLNLQFFVSIEGKNVVGGEALCRWRHPRKGLLGPDHFIPLLEKEGRIDQLDLYNLDKACAFLQQLNRVRERDFSLSCNFSRSSLARADLLDRCRETLSRYTFPRHRLIVEITEGVEIQGEDTQQVYANIRALRSMGFRVMFDDFGMGFTAFQDLQDYPMDGLKLDKSLVDHLGTANGRAVVDGIVRTGHQLGLTILAEGVEEAWQAEQLRELHCDLLQGFLFSMPIPAAEAMRRLLSQGGEGDRPAAALEGAAR